MFEVLLDDLTFIRVTATENYGGPAMLCAQAPVGIQRPTICRERGQESPEGPEGEVSAPVDQSGGEDAFKMCLQWRDF